MEYNPQRKEYSLLDFIVESNDIEGIVKPPSADEVAAYEVLLASTKLTILDMINFNKIVQPDAHLRLQCGQNVCVGKYSPPPGGEAIGYRLETLLNSKLNPWDLYCDFENLHPFSDGNGRTGRVLWLHRMGGIQKNFLGFLRHFHYQSLEHYDSIVGKSRSD